MDVITIRGGRPLRGTVAAAGSKNAALPIMAASILATEPVILERVPCVTDVDTLALNLSARYQIFRHISVIGSYTFVRQRASGGATNTGSNAGTNDVDQNIVTLGLQFGYPINFD